MRDNLHVHTNGAFIGRYTASEPLSDEPIRHDEPLPGSFEAQLGGVVFRMDGREVTVEPLGVTAAYTCADSVSDRQLLLAAHHRLRPSGLGLAMLAGIGYFPGDASLFSEITRISLLDRWTPARRVARRTRSDLELKVDDDAMVERLISRVPLDAAHSVGLSGGYDSRFVLGVLHQAGADLRVVRFTDKETELVSAICDQLDVPLVGIGNYSDRDGQRSAYEFTLLSDAQIWHGTAQFGRMRDHLGPHDIFHTGQFSDSVLKNAFKTAWKKPTARKDYWDRLVRVAFLGVVPNTQPTLREYSEREDVASAVADVVDYQRSYVDFPTRKAWANWMYFINRGTRWAQAFHDDLTFSCNLHFLLSDLDAQLMGIGTGFWDNMNNDRVARLNRRLLPTVTIPYASGDPVDRHRGPVAAWEKLKYEYITRFLVRQRAQAHLRSIEDSHETDLPASEPAGYDALFDRPMTEVATSGTFGLRRANVTLVNVLTYLELVDRAISDGAQ